MKRKRLLNPERLIQSPGWAGLLGKLCLVCGMLFMLSFPVTANSQQSRVSLSLDNVTLEQFIDAVKEQTGMKFLYNSALFKQADKVSVNVKKEPMDVVLESTLGKHGFVCDFQDDVVVIRQGNQTGKPLPPVEKKTVRGIVKDKDGLALPGVSILVKGTQTGVATDVNGQFEIKLDNRPDITLVFSFVGMKNQEVKVGQQAQLNVVMDTDSENLDEVVVTGYQTISKERATGSFGTISTRNIESKLQSNLASLIEGQATGVVIDKTGKIEIRGVSTFNAETTPLIVVDGFPISGTLETINPDNVENITVLKDGVAASIYGSRAANGVIVVTTKKGSKADGGKFVVSYKGIFGAILRPQLSALHKASSADYIDAELDLYNQNPNSPSTTSKGVMGQVTWLMMQVRENNMSEADAMAKIEELKKVDGLKQAEEHVFRPQLSQQHNLAITGGNAKNQYNAAVNYMSANRNMIHSDNSRLIVDLKNDWNPTKYVSLGVVANVVYTTDHKSTKGWNDLLAYKSTGPLRPYDNLVDESGNPTDIFYTSTYKIDTYKNTPGMKAWNYNAIEDLGKSTVDATELQMRIGGNLRVNIIEGLNAEVGGVWSRGNMVKKTLNQKDSYLARIAYNDATSKTNYANHYVPDGAIIDEERNINQNWTLRTQINFNRAFNEEKHRVTLLLGNEVRRDMYDNNTYATRTGYNETAGTFIPVNVKEYNSGVKDIDMLFGRTTLYSMNTGKYELRDNRFVSWYGNGSYEFDSRFIISGSVRLDLTNFFGTDKKYRYKPLWSVGGTYKLAEENFFQVDWINRLNVRASYGVNGNISLSQGPFLILSAGGYVDQTGGVSYSVSAPPNNQLRWERTATTNVGTDISFLDNRFNLSLDYYYKNSTDLLAKDAIDPTTGFSSLTKNMGAIYNRGVEIAIDADIIKQSGFLWHSAFNFTFNTNKVKKYNVTRNYASQFMYGTPLTEGYAANPLFAYRYAGLNNNGEVMCWNAAGEKVTAANVKVEDIVYMGSVRPKFDLAFTNSFKYKDFGLSFMLIAKLGHKYRKDSFTGSNYQNRHVSERWRKPGDEATKIYPKLLSWNMDMTQMPNMDILVGNASYMKLRDITLSYNLPKRILSPIGVTSAQVYFQTRNLFCITAKGTDIDPEIAELYDSSKGYNSATDYGYTSLPFRPEFYVGLSFNF